MLRRSSRSSTAANTAATEKRLAKKRRIKSSELNRDFILVDPVPMEWIGNREFILARILTPIRLCPILETIEFSFAYWGVTNKALKCISLDVLATERGFPQHANFRHYMVVIAKGSSGFLQRLGIPDTHISPNWLDIEFMSFAPFCSYEPRLIKQATTMDAAIDAIWSSPEFPKLRDIIVSEFNAHVPKE